MEPRVESRSAGRKREHEHDPKGRPKELRLSSAKPQGSIFEAKEPINDNNGKVQRPRLKVSTSAFIQTLRGRLLEHDVALVCCGESHEDVIDLTRESSVVEPKYGWVQASEVMAVNFNPRKPIAIRRGLRLQTALKWAESVIRRKELDKAIFTFESSNYQSYSRIFEHDPHRTHVQSQKRTIVKTYEWVDLDNEARAFNQRRLARENIPSAELDALIASRKKDRRGEGTELFDDWIIRQMSQRNVHLVLETPVPARELELHTEIGMQQFPPTHECLKRVPPDSDEDEAEADHPYDGTGAFLRYLRRRVESKIPEMQVHGIDPRELGAVLDTDPYCNLYQQLIQEPLEQDSEQVELETLGGTEGQSWHRRARRYGPLHKPLPSWEAFFGSAAELLYYAPQIKTDYVPFLKECIQSVVAFRRFFDALYFGTVDEALQEIRLNEDTLPFARIRSSIYRPTLKGMAWRRSDDKGLVPVTMAPVRQYLKGRGSEPPRTWISALMNRVCELGAGVVADKAKKWFQNSVDCLIDDPKAVDNSGDYFVAWLRESHRHIYDDIDTSDPEKLNILRTAPSEAHPRSRKHWHDLESIRIPGIEHAFVEFAKFDPKVRSSSKRERVLAQIMIDSFQLKLVDLAAILKVVDIVASQPDGSPIVVVLYLGSDHTNNVIDFWKSIGFGHKGLPRKGLVGKLALVDEESRALTFPRYLHDFSKLFPVPT